MKLITTIQPRRDGTVTVRDAKGQPIVFKPDDAGVLTADVEDAALVGRLLLTNNFEPADEADHATAEALLRDAQPPGDDDDDDDDDDLGDPDAPPVEGNTPPKPADAPQAAKANTLPGPRGAKRAR